MSVYLPKKRNKFLLNKERVINMDRFIDITQLSKSFGQQKVLDNIDFQLKKSEIIGLIGPSGSGKSTLIKTMLGMEKADTGKALVLDKIMPERKILGNIGYMAQS